MEENNNESQKNLIELLKELAAVQADNMKLTFAIRVREARDAVKAKIQSVKNTIIEKAKGYGTKARKLAKDYVEGKNNSKLVQGLEETIMELERQYEEGLRDLNDERANLEIEENDVSARIGMLREAIKSKQEDITIMTQQHDALTEKRTKIMEKFRNGHGDDETIISAAQEFLEMYNSEEYRNYQRQKTEAKEKAESEITMFSAEIEKLEASLKKIRADLETARQKEEEYSRDIKIDINTLKEEKETIQGMIPQQNRWQRMLGAFFNRINGADKFTKDVIDKIKAETDRIATEEIPKMKSKTKEKVTKTIGQIAARARDAKYATIDRAQKRLDAKKEKNATLTQRRNVQLGVDEVEEEEQSI